MTILVALAWGAVVGGSLVVGALAGVRLPLWERVGTAVITFGGGLLIGALAFDLVPEAERQAGLGLTAGGLLVGAGGFVLVDRVLTRDAGREDLRRTLQAASSGRAMGGDRAAERIRGESIARGITADGVPETAALGVTVAEGRIGVALLAGVIVSNLVESYGATQAIRAGGAPPREPLRLFGAVALVLLVALVAGATLLSTLDPKIIGVAEAVAGGAIFATVNIAIIPHAFADVSHWAPVATTLGLVAGFLLA